MIVIHIAPNGEKQKARRGNEANKEQQRYVMASHSDPVSTERQRYLTEVLAKS